MNGQNDDNAETPLLTRGLPPVCGGQNAGGSPRVSKGVSNHTRARAGRFSKSATPFARRLIEQNREFFETLANR
jgi:hypothetical protein